MPISRLCGIELFCLDPMYLSNHAVSATGDPRSRNAWPNQIHSTGSGKITPSNYHSATHLSCSDAVERACPGRPGWNEWIIGYKNPAKLRSDPCCTNARRDGNELGTFLTSFIYSKRQRQDLARICKQGIFTMIQKTLIQFYLPDGPTHRHTHK